MVSTREDELLFGGGRVDGTNLDALKVSSAAGDDGSPGECGLVAGDDRFNGSVNETGVADVAFHNSCVYCTESGGEHNEGLGEHVDGRFEYEGNVVNERLCMS